VFGLRRAAGRDHKIVLLEIVALSARPTVAPLVFHASTFMSVQALGG
jgi:hypothetical protein